MQLHITRSQNQGTDGITFTLTCKLEASDDERALIKRYGIIKRMNEPNAAMLRSLLDEAGGHVRRAYEVWSMRAHEEHIRKLCKDIVAELAAIQSWDGSEDVRLP